MGHNLGIDCGDKFWRQTLGTAEQILEGAIFTFPEKILSSTFFYNTMILRNKKVVKKETFPEIYWKVNTLSDLFYPGICEIMSWDDFCVRYSSNITQEKFTDIRYIIKLAFQTLGIDQNRMYPAHYPVRPLIVDIALLSK